MNCCLESALGCFISRFSDKGRWFHFESVIMLSLTPLQTTLTQRHWYLRFICKKRKYVSTQFDLNYMKPWSFADLDLFYAFFNMWFIIKFKCWFENYEILLNCASRYIFNNHLIIQKLIQKKYLFMNKIFNLTQGFFLLWSFLVK